MEEKEGKSMKDSHRKEFKKMKTRIRDMAVYGAVVGILLGFLIYLMVIGILIFVQNPTVVIRPESYFFIAINYLIRLYLPAILVFIGSIIAGILVGFYFIPV